LNPALSGIKTAAKNLGESAEDVDDDNEEKQAASENQQEINFPSNVEFEDEMDKVEKDPKGNIILTP